MLNDCGEILGLGLVPTSLDFAKAGEEAFAIACRESGITMSEIRKIISTGYGRRMAPFADGFRTEITCHSKGAYRAFPFAMTLIDIGGQDAKVIWLDSTGRQTKFRMNRTCAAGTGLFLEEIARRIGVSISELNALAERSQKEIELGSYCTIFASSEILALAAKGEKIEDIVKASFRSVVKRVLDMTSISGRVVATGGVVAHNPVLVDIMSKMMGEDIFVPAHAQFIGAIGAGLIAMDECRGETI